MALRDVNLVPSALLERRYMLRHGVAWVAAFALLAVVLLAAYSVRFRVAVRKGGDYGSEEATRQELMFKIAEIRKKTANLEQLHVIREITRSIGSSEMLRRLAQDMDPHVWLTQLTIAAKSDKSATLLLSGQSRSHAHLGALMKALTDSGHFTGVLLEEAAEVPGAGAHSETPKSTVQFRISMNMATE